MSASAHPRAVRRRAHEIRHGMGNTASMPEQAVYRCLLNLSGRQKKIINKKDLLHLLLWGQRRGSFVKTENAKGFGSW